MTEQSNGEVNLTVEERARMMGWMPREEFPGDPSKWVDAETYVRRAEEQLPILRDTLRRLERRLAAQTSEMRQMQSDFKHFMELARKAQERAYERALEELKARQRQAVDERDVEAFERASREYEELVRRHPAVTGKDETTEIQAQLAAIEAEKRALFEEWASRNPWFGTDMEMTEYAWKVNDILARTYPHMPVGEALERITAEVMRKFGSKQAKAPRSAAAVEAPTEGGTTGKRTSKTYHDLPPEAKEVCDRLVRLGHMTREEYVKSYFEAYPDG